MQVETLLKKEATPLLRPAAPGAPSIKIPQDVYVPGKHAIAHHLLQEFVRRQGNANPGQLQGKHVGPPLVIASCVALFSILLFARRMIL